jgi:uncharacterized protein (TIGR02996 family)
MLTSDRDALIRAVYAAPADDAPRLVYADWLDEHDDPARAEFIRLQCELARMTTWAAPRRRAAEERAAELLREHQKRWLGDLAAHPGDWQFRRGFPDELQWARHPPAELEAVLRLLQAPDRVPPDVRLARFVTYFPTNRLAGLIAECPAAVHLRSLWLIGAPDERFRVGLVNIAWGTHLAGLVDLDLERNNLDDSELRFLYECSHLGSLRRLNLSESRFRPAAFARFLLARQYGGLGELGLNGCELTPEHLAAFAPLKAFLHLTALHLSANRLDREGMEALAAAPFVPELREIDLSANRLADSGAAAVAEAPWDRLEHLDLGGNGIGDKGAIALARSPTLGNLRRLILRNNLIGEAGVSALVKRFPRVVLRM